MLIHYKTIVSSSREDILKESRDYHILPKELTNEPLLRTEVRESSTLPKDSINLLDINQIQYYEKNTVVRKGLDVISSRRLNTAVNKPASLWVSLSDFIHKNRLVIPFYNKDNKIQF